MYCHFAQDSAYEIAGGVHVGKCAFKDTLAEGRCDQEPEAGLDAYSSIVEVSPAS